MLIYEHAELQVQVTITNSAAFTHLRQRLKQMFFAVP